VWLSAASHVVSLVCPNPHDPYRAGVAKIIDRRHGLMVRKYVGHMAALLQRLVDDVDDGLIGSVAAAATAETLDDLLDQASNYHREQHQQGAGILATAVFEDTVRRVARAHDITDTDIPMDSLVTSLDKKGTITSVVAKRCRAAAGVRNHALHAQWDKFSLEDVDAVIRLTRQLLSEHLTR
jgi:hypothetical protein